MKIWDISQILSNDLPVWPGEARFSLDRHVTIGENCPVNVGTMHISLHAGSHADSPFHYDAQGLASADCELTPYIGPCIVVDCRSANEIVDESDIKWESLVGAQRVLFRTYERFPLQKWDSSFKAVAATVIARLGHMGVQLVGTDAASLDPETSKTLDAHHEVRLRDMRILEGLVLDDVPPGRYELIALPLRIAGADASPVRAILREIL